MTTIQLPYTPLSERERTWERRVILVERNDFPTSGLSINMVYAIEYTDDVPPKLISGYQIVRWSHARRLKARVNRVHVDVGMKIVMLDIMHLAEVAGLEIEDFYDNWLEVFALAVASGDRWTPIGFYVERDNEKGQAIIEIDLRTNRREGVRPLRIKDSAAVLIVFELPDDETAIEGIEWGDVRIELVRATEAGG